MFEFSKTPLIILLLAVVGVALFWWPGFLTQDKAAVAEKIEKAKDLFTPSNEINDQGKWVKGAPDEYPVDTILTNGDGSQIQVEITGRSQTMVRFLKKGSEASWDYAIAKLSPGSQNAVRELPVNLDIKAPEPPKDRIVAGLEEDIKRANEQMKKLQSEMRIAENNSVRSMKQKEIDRRKADLKKLERRLSERKAALK